MFELSKSTIWYFYSYFLYSIFLYRSWKTIDINIEYSIISNVDKHLCSCTHALFSSQLHWSSTCVKHFVIIAWVNHVSKSRIFADISSLTSDPSVRLSLQNFVMRHVYVNRNRRCNNAWRLRGVVTCLYFAYRIIRKLWRRSCKNWKMLAARICRTGASPGLASFVRTPIIPMTSRFSKGQIARFVSEGRSSYTRTARRRPTVAERAAAPAGETGKSNIFIRFVWNCYKYNNLKQIIENVSTWLLHLCNFVLIHDWYDLQQLMLEKQQLLEEQW